MCHLSLWNSYLKTNTSSYLCCVLIILFHGSSAEHLLGYVYHLSAAASETIPTW